MKIERAESVEISIWMAGDVDHARQVCRQFCFDAGECVTLAACDYIYTGGLEAGFRVGFINYPRFPRDEVMIRQRAEELGMLLMEKLCQHSFTIQAPSETVWYSRRP